MNTRQANDILRFFIGLILLILINQVSSNYFFRADLTEEKKYSIRPATKQLLNELDDYVYIDVYLEGDLNAGFKRLQKAIRETLDEFEIHSDHKVRFNFSDPLAALSQSARNEYMQILSEKGIQPTNVIDTRDGNRVEKIIIPGAVITYAGAEKGVMLLTGTRGEDQLNSSIENVEYNLASAIYQLTTIGRKKIGFIRGHGELEGEAIVSFKSTLFENYDIEDYDLPSLDRLPDVDLMIVPKPTRTWSEEEKFKLDQYIMRGGKAIFLVDRVEANMDSANREFNVSFPYNTNLDDMLFRYGVRINSDLVQDNNAALYPIVTGFMGDQPQITPIPWPFYPILNRFADHPVSRNLDGLLIRFGNSIDTVKAVGIKKTPLLFTSDYSRTISTPAQVSVADLRNNLRPEDLSMQNIPVACLLEGRFTSIYKNRFLPEGIETSISDGIESKILVVADGDFIKNDIGSADGSPPVLGEFRNHPGIKFSNLDFMLNAVAYMVEEEGIITARNKTIMIRPLDRVKVTREKGYWQVFNIVSPLLLTLLIGAALFFYRRSKYSRFK